MIFSGALVVAIIIAILIVAQRRQTASSQVGAPGGDLLAAPERRVSLITEAIAYIGTVLILAGGVAAIGQRWDGISAWGHFGIVVGVSLVFLAIGAVAFPSREPAFQRMVSVVWVLAAGGAAAAMGLFCNDVRDFGPETTTLLVGLTVLVLGGVLWNLRKTPLQQLVVFAGLLTTVMALIDLPAGESNPLVMAFVLWAFCLGWAALGWFELLEPSWLAVPVGAIAALMVLPDAVDSHGWMYIVAIGTAGAYMALSVMKKNTVLLGIGAIGLFAYVTSAVIRYFGDTLGVPAALAMTGVLILVIAAVSARLLRVARGQEHPTKTDASPKTS